MTHESLRLRGERDAAQKDRGVRIGCGHTWLVVARVGTSPAGVEIALQIRSLVSLLIDDSCVLLTMAARLNQYTTPLSGAGAAAGPRRVRARQGMRVNNLTLALSCLGHRDVICEQPYSAYLAQDSVL